MHARRSSCATRDAPNPTKERDDVEEQHRGSNLAEAPNERLPFLDDACDAEDHHQRGTQDLDRLVDTCRDARRLCSNSHTKQDGDHNDADRLQRLVHEDREHLAAAYIVGERPATQEGQDKRTEERVHAGQRNIECNVSSEQVAVKIGGNASWVAAKRTMPTRGNPPAQIFSTAPGRQLEARPFEAQEPGKLV